MNGNAKARYYLEEILTGVRFGVRFADRAKTEGGDPVHWEGFAMAMRTVEDHATKLVGILDREDAEDAAELVTNVIDLADRRRTS